MKDFVDYLGSDNKVYVKRWKNNLCGALTNHLTLFSGWEATRYICPPLCKFWNCAKFQLGIRILRMLNFETTEFRNFLDKFGKNQFGDFPSLCYAPINVSGVGKHFA